MCAPGPVGGDRMLVQTEISDTYADGALPALKFDASLSASVAVCGIGNLWVPETRA